MLARLVSHSECSTAVLELARGERLLASLLGAVPAEAARLSSLSDRALSADGVLVEPLCTQLHAVGFGLKMSAAAEKSTMSSSLSSVKPVCVPPLCRCVLQWAAVSATMAMVASHNGSTTRPLELR